MTAFRSDWLAPTAAVVTMLGFMQHLVLLLTTPLATQNIYQQQRQMHEFAVRSGRHPSRSPMSAT